MFTIKKYSINFIEMSSSLDKVGSTCAKTDDWGTCDATGGAGTKEVKCISCIPLSSDPCNLLISGLFSMGKPGFVPASCKGVCCKSDATMSLSNSNKNKTSRSNDYTSLNKNPPSHWIGVI
jgi:hypothetical protein